MVRHVLLLALMAGWVAYGDPEPTPEPKPLPSLQPEPSAKPEAKAEPEAEPKAEPEAAPKAEALTDHRMHSYRPLPLAPSYESPAPSHTVPEAEHRAAESNFEVLSPIHGDPAPSNGIIERNYGPPPSYGAVVEQLDCYPRTHFKTTWGRMTQYKTHWATQTKVVAHTKYKYVTATSYWPTTLTEWKEVVKTLPYKLVAKTQVVYRTKTLLKKHQEYTNTEYVWYTQNYMDHHTVTRHITKYATKTNYYTDTVTEYVQEPAYYTETATVYEAKYRTKTVPEHYYETSYKTVKKPQQTYVTEYTTKHQYRTVYHTYHEPVYHTVTRCPSSSYDLPAYH